MVAASASLAAVAFFTACGQDHAPPAAPGNARAASGVRDPSAGGRAPARSAGVATGATPKLQAPKPEQPPSLVEFELDGWHIEVEESTSWVAEIVARELAE